MLRDHVAGTAGTPRARRLAVNGRTIETMARAYGRAYVRVLDASGVGAINDAANDVALAQHDLLLAVLDRCVICQPGSCPGMLSGNR